MIFSKAILRNPFHYIIIGFILRTLGEVGNILLKSNDVIAIFGIISWYFLIKGYLKIFNKGLHNPLRGFYKYVFYFYIIQCIIMILRGYIIDYDYQWISIQGMINFHLFSPFYILPYIMPLIIFIPYKYYNLTLFSKASCLFALILIAIFIFQFNQILHASILASRGFNEGNYGIGGNLVDIYVPFAFIILCKKYIPSKIWYINCLGLTVALLITLIAARRGSSTILALLFIFNFIVLLQSIRGAKKIIYLFIFLITILASISFFSHSNKFTFIRERGLEDTRSNVDNTLLSQMNSTELIFGKGLNGRYYLPLLEDDYLNGWRYGTETGFYNLVLKGGYLMAFTYVILLFYPAFLGIFKSKNLLSKSFGFYILLSLVELYPFGWLAFNAKFLTIWIGISLCISPKFRSLNDYQIKTYIFKQ